MPFKSDKQRKYLYAKKPDVAKKLAHKYTYGGTIGGGESVAGTSSDGTENRHVFEGGGMPMSEEEVKKSRMKKGVPGYKLRRFLDKLGGSDESAPEKKPEKKKSRFHLIEQMFKKKK